MINKIKKILSSFTVFAKFIYYLVLCRAKKIDNREVWLLSERGDDACDNAYHLYKYIKDKHPEIHVKYVIAKKSNGYPKINKEDIVIFGSKQHYILFLTAGKLISTHIMGYSPSMTLFARIDRIKKINPRARRIFLQHGITKDYIPYLSNDKTNLDLFVCGAEKECDYVKTKFGFDNGVVKRLGFARFDVLDNELIKNHRILIMPTFRKNNNYVSDFKKTQYFKKWNSLLNSKELIEYICKNNIEIVFCPHPLVGNNSRLFKSSCEKIKINNPNKNNIQELLRESEMLITDYSSVAFDFAYMEKPVVYYQFDYEEYRKSQYSEGYFDYKTMGFGPLAKREDELVALIINGYDKNRYIENERMFFGEKSKNNCENIFEEIKKFDRTKVVIVSSRMDVGGIETFLMNVVRNFNDINNEYDISFLTYHNYKFKYEDELNNLGVKIYRITSANKHIRHMLELHKFFKKYRPDVVHAHTYFDCAAVMAAAKRYGVKVRISHSHTTAPDQFGRKIYHNILAREIRRKSTNLLACGEDAGYTLFRKNEFEIMRNGIKLDNFRFSNDKRTKIRRQLSIGSKEVVIGHVGRLTEVKNHTFLIDVFNELYKNNNMYRLILIGDGELKGKVLHQIHELGLDGVVTLLQNKENIYDYYNAFDIIVFPSIYEGLPMVLVEAQANGVPIISSSSVTRESKMNSNFKFIDLSLGRECWADEILKYPIKRVLPDKKVEDYSIEKIVIRLKQIYSSKGGK